jgi:hypothetical protein
MTPAGADASILATLEDAARLIVRAECAALGLCPADGSDTLRGSGNDKSRERLSPVSALKGSPFDEKHSS